MAIIRTKDHEEIRAWIEEHGGKPAIIKDTTEEESTGVLSIDFDGGNGDLRQISWREFFTMFDARNLRFRYESPVSKENAPWSYEFESSDEPLDSGEENEEEGMPEDLEYMDENLFPSEPEWPEGSEPDEPDGSSSPRL